MKKYLIAAVALGAVTMGGTAMAAPPYTPINVHQNRLEARIEQGVRQGDLTRREARRLYAELDGIARLEARYRRGGFTLGERADLDRRLDAVSRQIRFQRHDNDHRRYR